MIVPLPGLNICALYEVSYFLGSDIMELKVVMLYAIMDYGGNV